MTKIRSIFRTAAAMAAACAFTATEVFAASPILPERPKLVVLASGDCYAIGEAIAAQNGGTLAKAAADTQNGQAVCIIVVLVPGKNGQRPRRAEFVVPQ